MDELINNEKSEILYEEPDEVGVLSLVGEFSTRHWLWEHPASEHRCCKERRVARLHLEHWL